MCLNVRPNGLLDNALGQKWYQVVLSFFPSCRKNVINQQATTGKSSRENGVANGNTQINKVSHPQ